MHAILLHAEAQLQFGASAEDLAKFGPRLGHVLPDESLLPSGEWAPDDEWSRETPDGYCPMTFHEDFGVPARLTAETPVVVEGGKLFVFVSTEDGDGYASYFRFSRIG